MSDFTFPKDEYLQRIHFNTTVSINYECLKSLHSAQHVSIPFENFDICLGRNIPLDPESIFQKLVNHQRGGYCFELNGLFSSALNAFGFDARPLLGRVHITGEPTGRSHQTTLVTIGDKSWIADLGFGAESPRIPVPLNSNEVASFEKQTYRIVDSEIFGNMVQSKEDENWKDLFSFDLHPVLDIDITFGNHYTSTHPDSFFMAARIAALPVENGMAILFNDRLKKAIDGKEEVILLKDDTSYLAVLEKEFGIVLDAKYMDLKPMEI